MSADPEPELPVEESAEPQKAGSTALRVVTWFSVGIAVAALGIYVGASCATATGSRSARRTTSTPTPARTRPANLASASSGASRLC